MLTKYEPSRNLRSADTGLLIEKTSRLKCYGDRAFSVCAPHLWNKLPTSLRLCEDLETFKKQLKTYLYSVAHN